MTKSVMQGFLNRRLKRKKEKQFSEENCFYGAGDEARTRYLHLGKVALYQMSYTREQDVLYQIIEKCQPIF